MKYNLSSPAKNDLRNIYQYTLKNHGSRQADAYLNGLYEAFESALNYPRIGISYITQQGYEFRKLLFANHLIYYTEEPGELIIQRVLHSRMDIKTELDDL